MENGGGGGRTVERGKSEGKRGGRKGTRRGERRDLSKGVRKERGIKLEGEGE
jgi:hypothetical protein